MRSLRNRLTAMFLFIIGISVLGTGIFVALLLKASTIDSLKERLEKEGRLLVESVNREEFWRDPSLLQQQADRFGDSLDVRVTLIDKKGEVVGDSAESSRRLGNMKNHPEVARALSPESQVKVRSIREDTRLDMFIPVVEGKEQGKALGVVRLSMELEIIDQRLSQVWVSLAGGLLFSFALASMISSRVARNITQPIEEMTQVAVDIARNKLHRRIPVNNRDEIGRLATAINRMAAGLRYQLETIRKSERRLTGVIETMDSGLIMVDSKRKITLANQAFHRFFNLKPRQLLNKSLPEGAIFHDLNRLISKCLESGERVREEIHLYFPEERIMEARLTPIWEERGGTGVMAVIHEITAIRRLEKMRTEFVANVSHELKTPVTSLRGFAETLLDGAAEDPDMRKEFLEIIQTESLRLERLITDLLDLSKIESRNMPLDIQSIDIGELLRSTAKTVEEQMRKQELSFRVKTEEEFLVQVDPDRFSQILLNLLSNAMAYTPVGGEVILSAGRGEAHWWIRVSDTGIGIPEKDLPRIFERFYRVDKARSRESGGTGLGLAIVKHLVEAHRGEIQVTSRVGIGTEITLTFPR
ncbi:PAS domain-containing sensor histidine kinase [Kroppenstedtia guangzhouensis]|uniref:histidine kinase n=1 Tax=Kroppenstedtia guangzhouensis TaxID=1274356 RepID=A0ABQ1GX97_9BACL|nr:ATP-binding protein [Kroppenstedtia guangzhouensis]GGA51752.1 PAS domain-containing sensor histidine kinase [Kroppenstedtia guangzhouensis]